MDCAVGCASCMVVAITGPDHSATGQVSGGTGLCRQPPLNQRSDMTKGRQSADFLYRIFDVLRRQLSTHVSGRMLVTATDAEGNEGDAALHHRPVRISIGGSMNILARPTRPTRPTRRQILDSPDEAKQWRKITVVCGSERPQVVDPKARSSDQVSATPGEQGFADTSQVGVGHQPRPPSIPVRPRVNDDQSVV